MLPRHSSIPDDFWSVGLPFNHSHCLTCGNLIFLGGQIVNGIRRGLCFHQPVSDGHGVVSSVKFGTDVTVRKFIGPNLFFSSPSSADADND